MSAAHLSLHATWRSFLPLSTSFIISDQSGRLRGRDLCEDEINDALVSSPEICMYAWMLAVLAYLSFSSVCFCVSLSTRFSPGANGGGGGGGALGTNEGSGGGAGTATEIYGMDG